MRLCRQEQEKRRKLEEAGREGPSDTDVVGKCALRGIDDLASSCDTREDGFVVQGEHADVWV